MRLLKIQWPDCPYDIMLSTETKKYECDFLNLRTINSGKELSWSARLKNTLNQIQTEYVLFFLEDFFLLDKVRVDILNLAIQLMDSDERIGLITFNKRRWGTVFPENTDFKNCFIELPKNVAGRTNVLVGLWRTEYYRKLILTDENPWEYEKESNLRSKFAGYKIYTQDYTVSSPAFRYCMNPADGYGITQQKWLCKNKELFESYGIFNVNYDNLGVFEEEISYDYIQMQSRIHASEKQKIKKEEIKKENYLIRTKETLYELKKKVKKGKIANRLKYIAKCIYYFMYYKLNK